MNYENLFKFSGLKNKIIIFNDHTIYNGYCKNCECCEIRIDGNLDKFIKYNEFIFKMFNDESLNNYDNIILYDSGNSYRPCKWFNNSCNIDAVLLFLCILNDKTNNLIFNNIKKDKDIIKYLFDYIKFKRDWKDVEKYREYLLNKIVKEKNLKSRFCDVQTLLMYIFDTDDAEIKIENITLCDFSIDSDYSRASNLLYIIYTGSHFAVVYNSEIYDSMEKSHIKTYKRLIGFKID